MKLIKGYYVIVFLILTLLAHPFYMKQSAYDWIYKSAFENDKAHIEICTNKPIELSKATKDITEIDIKKIKLNGLHCTKIELPITRKWIKYNISFKSQENGVVLVRLRAPDKWNSNDLRQLVLVDYKNLFINKNAIDMPERAFWAYYTYETYINKVKKGETNTIAISTRQHHLKFSDFKIMFKTYSFWHISSLAYLIGTISIIIFSLFLFYRKKYKHLFCFIVFLFLILPNLYISKEDISKQENRNLYKFPSLFQNRNINEKFGVDFDNWFSDRFGGRLELTDLRFIILYFINNKIANDRAFVADENWIFPTNGIKKIDSLQTQRSENLKIINSLKKISNSFKGKNIQIYLVLEPSRSLLYKKYWDKYYPYISYHDYVTELKNALKDYHNIHFIDLKYAFEKNKDKFLLYEKNDPHMTLHAVNIMLEEIISALGNDIKKQYKKSISYKNHKCKLYKEKYYEDILKISTTDNRKENCKEIIIKNTHVNNIKSEDGINEVNISKPYINKNLYILFPCYEEYIFPILAEFYSHTTSINYNKFTDDKKTLIQKNKGLSKLRNVSPGTTILIFLSHPTEYALSNSNIYLEEY